MLHDARLIPNEGNFSGLKIRSFCAHCVVAVAFWVSFSPLFPPLCWKGKGISNCSETGPLGTPTPFCLAIADIKDEQRWNVRLIEKVNTICCWVACWKIGHHSKSYGQTIGWFQRVKMSHKMPVKNTKWKCSGHKQFSWLHLIAKMQKERKILKQKKRA